MAAARPSVARAKRPNRIQNSAQPDACQNAVSGLAHVVWSDEKQRNLPYFWVHLLPEPSEYRNLLGPVKPKNQAGKPGCRTGPGLTLRTSITRPSTSCVFRNASISYIHTVSQLGASPGSFQVPAATQTPDQPRSSATTPALRHADSIGLARVKMGATALSRDS